MIHDELKRYMQQQQRPMPALGGQQPPVPGVPGAGPATPPPAGLPQQSAPVPLQPPHMPQGVPQMAQLQKFQQQQGQPMPQLASTAGEKGGTQNWWKDEKLPPGPELDPASAGTMADYWRKR